MSGLGSFAEFGAVDRYVRYSPMSRHYQARRPGLLRANTGSGERPSVDRLQGST